MTFKSAVLSDQPAFFNMDEFAESALYRPAAGGETPLVVIADALPPAEEEIPWSTRQALRLWVRASDLAQPALRDTLAFRNAAWAVTDVGLPTPDGLWPLIIERDQRLTFER